MSMLTVIGALCAFLYAFRFCIICIIRGCYVQFRRHSRGGVAYWRGRVFPGGIRQQSGAGVEVEQGGGADGGAVGEAAPGACLAVCLPGHAKRSGAAGRGGVAAFKQGEEVLHGGLPVHRARRVVIVNPSWHRFDTPAALRQLVVDGSEKGQSILFMPL